MHDKPRHTDKVLDQMICLEVMFLDRQRGELKLRLGLNVAHFLGNTSEERRVLLELMSSAYDARSSVAHGSVKKPRHRQTLSELDGVVRRCLRRYLEDAASSSERDVKKHIISELRDCWLA